MRIFRNAASAKTQRERWHRMCRDFDIVVSAPWDSNLLNQILLLAVRDLLREFRAEAQGSFLFCSP